MADPAEEVPLIDIQPEKMSSSWKTTLKLCVVIALSFALYGYLHIYIRSLWIRHKKLEKIGLMTINMEKMIQKLYVIDQNMSVELEELNDLYLD